ncbi:hypothetical protein EPH_0021050 [Eimeria praecox]|uniref:Uncharacterized protein n=1 Tax=Eimeria praecox TaxID=51316 RepID=U6H594_9EIME|nr:hypothetical protein EPH_0021050 [Eimeria praecox]
MGLLQRAMRSPVQPDEGCLCSSEEEDAADRALRFQQTDAGRRLKDERKRTDIQGVRDSFVLKSVLSIDECRRLVEAAEAQGFEYWAKETDNTTCNTVASSDNECQSSNHGSSTSGCNRRKDSSNNSSTSGSSSVSKRANHNYRSAHTLEVEHSDLASLIWQRVKEYVVKEVSFSEEDGERFERDLKGTWEACGVNSTLLFAREATQQRNRKRNRVEY